MTIPEINATTSTTWAEGLIRKGQHVVEHGFGLCHDGSEYDLENFLADTLCGDLPWNQPKLLKVLAALYAHPEFLPMTRAFRAKFGKTYFHETMEAELAAMDDPDCEE